MWKFGKESTEPKEASDRENGKGWLQNHCALAVCVVVIIALLLRTVFVAGVSAGSGFALSGGAEAQYHLHIVESILNGSFAVGSDAAINYPLGGLNVNPPLYDFIAAAVGSVTSASTALSVLAPIFGALTCFPVYLIGKELYGEKTGFVAALIYALMALPISSTVLSNGTEYAFTAFIAAFFTLALIKVVRKIADDELAIKELIIAGVLLGLIALSWNGFRSILVMLIIIMVIQMLVDRFNEKDFTVTLYSYSIMMLIGVGIAAAYYIPANLWDAVFSGPVLITIIAVAFGFIFKVLKETPWIFVVPGLIVAFAIIAIVLFFAAPDYCTALIFGNSVYTNSIMTNLASIGVTISKMSSYYGWLLMWAPIALGIYEFYIYASKDRSHIQLFITMWLIVLWIFSWTSYGAASVFGVIYAVASALILVKIITKADLKTYWTSMRAAGFPGFIRKLIKPVPLLTVLITAFLVIVPGLTYAVDAGISSNEDYGYFAYGNTTYTLETGEKYPYSYVYDDMQSRTFDPAVVSWIETAADLEGRGYSTVNDMFGTGASVVGQILLSEGSSGATAAQIVRILTSSGENYSSAFGSHVATYNEVMGYINDPASAKDKVISDSTTFSGVRSDITDENAVYFASINALTTELGAVDLVLIYENLMKVSGSSIGMYLVDGSMLPLMYGDGSSTSTIAYLAGYNTDSYGAATKFYSYLTYYSNYYPALANEALYDTFLWKALVGPSPTEAGYSSSFSYLYDLSSSDGSVRPNPGYGLGEYEVAIWYVKYNSNPMATSSDDGWKYMGIYDALEAQENEGGRINYLTSIILLDYVGAGKGTVSSSVVDEDGAPVSGIDVLVTTFDKTFNVDTVYAMAKTGADGTFNVFVPVDSPYSIIFKNGEVKLEATNTGSNYRINNATFVGNVVVSGMTVYSPDYLYMLTMDGKSIYIPTSEGVIDSSNAVDADGNPVKVVAGKYSYELRDASATAVGSGTITFYTGNNVGLKVSPTNYTITATVKDNNGTAVSGAWVVAMNTATRAEYYSELEDGKCDIVVPSGTYALYMSNGYITDYSSTLSVTSNRSVSLTAYKSATLSTPTALNFNLAVYGGSYSTISSLSSSEVPVSIGGTIAYYTIYGADSETVYLGTFDGNYVTTKTGAARAVSGTSSAAGTVSFINANNATVTANIGTDGKFNALLLDGTYTVYAYDANNNAYVGQITVSGNLEMDKITLVSASKLTVSYQYESNTSKANVALPYAPVSATFTLDGKTYTIPTMTGTDGKAVFYIPNDATDIKVAANGGSINNDAFNASSLSVSVTSGTDEASIVIPQDSMKKKTISVPYDVKLKPYSSTETVGLTNLTPGQYTATINASTGYYFDGTVYLYPGDNKLTGLNPLHVYGVKIVKGAQDELTITGDKSYDEYNDDGIYYFEYDCEYLIKSVNSETKGVKYATVNKTSSTTVVETLDMTTTDDPVKITGYVGVIGDGNLHVHYGETAYDFKIESGAFEIELPSSATNVRFYAQVTATVSNQKYCYDGDTEVDSISEGMIVNIPVYKTVDMDAYTAEFDAFVNNAVFDKGDMRVDLVLFNNSDSERTFAITAGSAWTLNGSKTITVAAKNNVDVTLTGTYEPNGSGIGTSGMTVIINDFNGSSSRTVPIIDGEVTPSDSQVTLKVASENGKKDRISGNEYQYALTFINSGGMNVTNIDVGVADGYSVVLMDETGALMKVNGSSMVIPASKTSVVYVKIMKETGEMTTVPSITVSTGFGDRTLQPSEMDIKVDTVTVSGDSAVSERSGIPSGLWFIFGLSIILLILIVWMGSKRGVFSRR